MFQPGHGWVRGGYTCQCKPGYYSATTKNMFNGSLVEVKGKYLLSRSLFLISGCLLWLLPTGLHYLLNAVRVPAMSSWMWHLHWWHPLSSTVQLASQTHPSLCLPLLCHLQHCHHPPCHQLQEDQGVPILQSNISQSNIDWMWNHVQVITCFLFHYYHKLDFLGATHPKFYAALWASTFQIMSKIK